VQEEGGNVKKRGESREILFMELQKITLRLLRASSDLATHFAPIGGLSEERGSEPRI
jgi:hypothetical protein